MARSDAAHAMLAALVLPDEVELGFGRVSAREGAWGLVTQRRILWGLPSLPERIGALELATVTSFQEIERAHRWSVRLTHALLVQRVHVPAHRVLWWSWGNAEGPVTFRETQFDFSRRDTALARALRDALGAYGPSQEPTVVVSMPPRTQRRHAYPLRIEKRRRLDRLRRKRWIGGRRVSR